MSSVCKQIIWCLYWHQVLVMRSTDSAYGNIYIYIYIYTYIHTYIFVVVNFDALAQASDIQIERRQVVFLCWMQDLNPGSQTPNRQQTECSLTNRLSYRGSSKNLNSTARPYDQRAFSPLDPTVSWLSHLALAIYIFVVVNFDALAQASDIQIERRQVVFLCWMQDLNPGSQALHCSLCFMGALYIFLDWILDWKKLYS